MRQRPSALTAICIIGIILASLASLLGLCGLGGLVMQFSGQQMALDPDMLAFQQKWLPVTTTILFVKLVLIGVVFFGTLSALNLHPKGRKRLLIAMWAGLVFEVAQIYPTVTMQLETFEIMKDEVVMQQPPGGGFSQEQFMELIKGMVIAVGVGLALLKGGYYCWGVVYASLDSTRRLFGEEGFEEPDADQANDRKHNREYDEYA